MNPASATVPTAAPKPMVNDIAPPPRPAAAQPAGQASMAPPNIIANIPVHNPSAAPGTASTAVNEDVELDQIMQDVNQEVKKIQKTKKGGMFSFLGRAAPKQNKPSVSTAVPLAASTTPVRTAPAPQTGVQAAMQSFQSVPNAAAQPTAAAPAAKPKKQAHAPVFAIFIALLVTGFLAAAAISAYH